MTETTKDLDEYVDRLSGAIDLPLAPEPRPGVVENFVRIAAIAQLVTEFPLPDTIEPAPVFEP